MLKFNKHFFIKNDFLYVYRVLYIYVSCCHVDTVSLKFLIFFMFPVRTWKHGNISVNILYVKIHFMCFYRTDI